MNIFILADEEQKKEILAKPAAGDSSVFFASAMTDLDPSINYDAYFILFREEEVDLQKLEGKPVFVNKVSETLSESGYSANVGRVNAWPGFLERPLWEAVSSDENKSELIFEMLNRKVIFVKDEPGFVSGRVISMIVNEAFFAFGENISTLEEIDMAMKLGTNYPNGPFEWAEKIGIEKIYLLLQKLAEKEERYQPAPALKKLYLETTKRV
ncbi:MAG: 3-hydroxyacyl-CoA dehydrogenase family protein [Ginsengibacter sp.]